MRWFTCSAPTAADTLHALIEMNCDSARGFRQAADQLRSAVIGHAFRVNASTRDLFARQLCSITAGGEDPLRTEGSPTASLHRWWLGVRGSLWSDQDAAILREAQFDEEALKARYERVLRGPMDQPVRELLQGQLDSVTRAWTRIREFRDRLETGGDRVPR